MANVKIPFNKCFRSEMILGNKTWEATTTKLGDVGDVFCVFDCMFVILATEKMPLSVVSAHFKEYGLKSSKEFISHWASQNLIGGYHPAYEVYVLQFKHITCHDCLLHVNEDTCAREDVAQELVHQYNTESVNNRKAKIDAHQFTCEEGYKGKGYPIIYLAGEIASLVHPFCRQCTAGDKCPKKKVSSTYATQYVNMYSIDGDPKAFCTEFSPKSKEIDQKEFSEQQDDRYKAEEQAYKQCRREIFAQINNIKAVHQP